MKIVVLDYTTTSVKIIDVEEKWLEEDLRIALPLEYTDQEWKGIIEDEVELIELFLFSYCNYDLDNIYYMAGVSEIDYYKPKSLR